MSLDLETVPETAVQGDLLETAASPLTLSLQDFVSEFGDELLDSLNRANPPVYTGQVRVHRQLILAALKRKLFPAQADVVHAVTELLVDRGERAAIVNGEMGCGKTTVGIATAAVLNAEGYRRTLVLSPPAPGSTSGGAKSRRRCRRQGLVLNGPDTLVKLLKLREQLGVPAQGQGVLRPGPRADADGVPLETCLRSPAHASRRRGGLPRLRACHHRPRRRADQPGRTRSRGVPPQVQPLPCTAVVVDPSERPVRQRPVLDRAQGTEAYSNHRGSHRAEADAKVR
ncbi:helicase [Pseudomonas aeruginosa]|nr:helicase [Pseudomonas aeruginosa]